jgi:hypothetical protein
VLPASAHELIIRPNGGRGAANARRVRAKVALHSRLVAVLSGAVSCLRRLTRPLYAAQSSGPPLHRVVLWRPCRRSCCSSCTGHRGPLMATIATQWPTPGRSCASQTGAGARLDASALIAHHLKQVAMICAMICATSLQRSRPTNMQQHREVHARGVARAHVVLQHSLEPLRQKRFPCCALRLRTGTCWLLCTSARTGGASEGEGLPVCKKKRRWTR